MHDCVKTKPFQICLRSISRIVLKKNYNINYNYKLKYEFKTSLKQDLKIVKTISNNYIVNVDR